MIVGQVLWGLAGFVLTLYAYYVKTQHKKNPNYKALCDFGPNASCSRVLTSKFFIHSMTTSPPSPDEIKSNGICQVCGDNASVINYGALTCASCRTFFRRNGFHTKEISPCRFHGHCEIIVSTRRRCTACRLAKCLAAGMIPELIRKEDLSATKRKFTESPNREIVEDRSTMTLSQEFPLAPPADTPFLNSSEWTIVSNVVHAFDTFSPVKDIRRTIETMNTSASNMEFNLTQTLRILSSFSNSLQLFISSTPDFQVLTKSEQWSLLQRNMLGLLSIGGIFLMRECEIFHKPENEMTILPLYGNDVIQQMKTLTRQLDNDPIIIKLLLVVLAFSSNSFTKNYRKTFDKDSLLLGTFRLFGSQNVYVELMWKYLIHRYKYDESVQRFSLLIKQLLDILKLSIEIYENNQTFQTFIDDIIEQIEQSQMINDKTIIPLWGKS